MVLFNHSTRELTAKIVYYGPGLCGKTTNLRLLHEKLEQGTTGRLLSLSTAQDRTIYFDLLPVELGNVKGYTVRFQLCTVPGQVFYNETRKLVLRGVDGIVFVVDSQWSMLSHNLESFQNLRENMAELDQTFDETAVVIQYNKRDLPGVLSVQALQESLGFQEYPFVEAVAASGKGVVETFKLVSKMTFVQLLRRLQRSPDGEKLGPEWVASPSEDTSRTARIPAVGAELLALTSTVGPSPAPPTESPFETTGSWPSMPRGEVFGDATVPPQSAFAAAPSVPDVPLEPASLPDAADDTLTDGPSVETVEETEPPERELSSPPEPTEDASPEVVAPGTIAAPEVPALPPPPSATEPSAPLVAAPPPPPPQPGPPPARASGPRRSRRSRGGSRASRARDPRRPPGSRPWRAKDASSSRDAWTESTRRSKGDSTSSRPRSGSASEEGFGAPSKRASVGSEPRSTNGSRSFARPSPGRSTRSPPRSRRGSGTPRRPWARASTR
jgi:GTPase SAR1 and related small G proteins